MSSIVSTSQRRRPYQCLKCLHRSDKTFIEARYRVYNHYLKEHVSLDAVPFYCKWCLFRSFKREDLEKHIHSYPRHKAVLREKGAHEDVDYLVENRAPYVISERDVAALSAAESQRHWQAAASKRGDFIAQAMEVTYLDTAMSPLLGAEVAVPMISPTPSFRMSPPTQLQKSPPPTLPAMAVPFPSAAPVEQSLDWRTLSPSVQTVVDVSQYLAPLQQLVGLLSSGQPTTEGVVTAASPVVAAPPEPEPQLPLQLPAVPTPSTPPPQPAPAESESLDVLDSLPTREECRALAPKSSSPSCATSSSSSSSSSAHEDRAEQRHQELMSAVKILQTTMSGLKDSFIETCQSTQHMAKLVLNLAAICVKQPAVVPVSLPSSTTSTATASLPQAPAVLPYTSFPPPRVPPFSQPPPMPALVQPPHIPSYVPPPPAPMKERDEPRSRDRSPLTERNPRQRSPRRERSRESSKENHRRHRSPAYQRGSDRRIIKSRWR